MLPLNGIRVLDLSTVVFGPYASQILADYGADVIKIETPEGDSTRKTGPTTEPGMSAIFLGVNRGKRSVVLDLKTPAAREALLKLVDTADVLMHSIRPQKLAAIGLDPDTLRKRNPRLVYVGLLGFSEDGPYGGMPAYDDIIQGLSGSAALMEKQTGTPQYFPTIAGDKTCALVAAHAILAALFKRERTGTGSYVEVPMLESMVAFNLVEHFYGQHFDPPLAAAGYPRVLNQWRRPYRTTDGYVCAMPYTDVHWQRFFIESGRPALASDERFINIAARTTHIAQLYEIAAEVIAGRSTDAWLKTFSRLEIPASPMLRLEELQQDEHLRQTGFFETLTDPHMGQLAFPGVPVKFDHERPPVRMAPRLGEHTEEVMAELGIAKPHNSDD
ncbi:CaiB/BaiF CoA transferase family protein [Noviherbaspirillum sp. Root189]|uniref:CaiB/BaiF CoA transferase family protein n=1 Tax=Noviherbaspirillum sp. Root189 TaxID=1736487 RepID=UPI00070C4A46|nr:CoA transferase [Noviherbaspirillum sp. Root189]KRB68009.1 acetyl-CoA acetyltransferase [Noviherbaspirillum sp. Root189]